MVLTYADENHRAPGKTSERSDAVDVEFVEMIPNRRIVTLVRFDANDAAYSDSGQVVT